MKYRRGSVIRQAVPHSEHPHGARRWRVLDVEGGDYYVMALFGEGGPYHALWDVAWCEKATELEWQDDERGRIGQDGTCCPWPRRQVTVERRQDDNARTPEDDSGPSGQGRSSAPRGGSP